MNNKYGVRRVTALTLSAGIPEDANLRNSLAA
jgi:hypothetical protein